MNPFIRRYLSHFATFILLFFSSLFLFAGPARTTYQAKIVKPDGYPLEAASVNFKFTILDPTGACILYSETYSSVNMSATGGLISFALGSGVKTYPVSATTFEQVFSNITASLSCDSGGAPSYSPAVSDSRKIVMQFHDGAGWQTLPAMNINAVPYAMYANEALKLNGKTDAAFVEVANIPTCLATEALRYNGATFSCVNTASVSAAAVVSALGYTPANGVSVTALTSSLSTTDSTVASVSSSVSSLQSSVGASFAALTSSQWVTNSTDISYNSGFVGIGTSNAVTRLDVSGGVRISMESATCAVSYAGTLRYNSGSVEYCNGTSWSAFGVAGAGITLVNGSASGTQTFATGITGTVFNIVSSNGVHSFNIPLAASASVTAGLLSNADYTTFTNKMNATSAAVISALGYTPINSSVSGTYALKANNLSDLTSATVARSNLGLGSLALLNYIDLTGAQVSGTLAAAYLPAFSGDVSSSAGSAILTLASVGAGVTSGTQYTKVTVDGKGRVTSGAQLVSSDVTTALGYTPASASASTQWTTSGSTINYTAGNVGIGTTNPTEKLSVFGNINLLNPGASVNRYLSLATNGGGEKAYIRFDQTYAPGPANYWDIGSVSGNNAYDFGFESSGTRRMTLTFAGNLGVGTSLPSAKLHLAAGASSLAPFKLTSGSLLTSPASGAIEYDGSYFYLTDGTNTRRAIATNYGTSFTTTNLDVSGALNLTNNANLYLTANAVDPGDIVFQTSSGTQKGRIWADPTATALFLSSGDTVPDIAINASGNVGIGTQTPSEKLEVSGAIKVPGVGQIGPAGTYGYAMYVPGTNNFVAQMYGAASGVQFTNSLGMNTLYISESGKVGLGTSSPIALLNLVGTDSYNNLLIDSPNYSALTARGGATSGWPLVQLNNQAAGGKSWNIEAGRHSSDSFGIYDTVSGITRLSISSLGNVGIGTSAPTNTLDIVGAGLTITRDQTFGTIATLRKAYTATNNEDPYVQFVHQTVSSGAFDRYGYIQSGIGHGGMAIQAQNGAGAGGNLMLNKLGGNVAVGTSTAASMTAKFNIIGSSAGEVAQYIHNTDPAGYAVLRMNNNWGGYASGTALHSFGPSYGVVGEAYAPLTTTLSGFESGGLNLHANTGAIRFFTGGNSNVNNQMLLSASGDLGIGTSAPAVKTHIYNQVDGPFVGLAIDNRKIYGAGTGINETSRMVFSLSEPTIPNVADRVMGYIEGGTESETSSAQTFMAFGTRSGGPATETEKMRINSAGYVGIGTSAPTARLNITGFGAANATALRIDSQDTFYRDIFMSEFNTTAYGGILRYNSGSDLLQLITVQNSVEKYGVSVARATGFVGIGMNTAAAYQLDVNGDIQISGTPYRASGDIAWTVPSDARLKDVKSSYSRGLKEILNIETIVYSYKVGNIKKIDPSKEFTGVLAQNVQKQIPEAVKVDKDGYLSLNTTPVFWAMINAIKDVYHEVTGVQREIASLKEENLAKDQEIKDLKERLDRIEKSLQK